MKDQKAGIRHKRNLHMLPQSPLFPFMPEILGILLLITKEFTEFQAFMITSHAS